MASFVDTQPYQFSPYIKTMPTEQMAQVGMYKQQQYDLGVQKVRGYLESIANLDVIKPEHVKYVEETLNKVKSEVKTVASQDFSNQQLVNSVGGLAKQVYKDQNIQNMLSDTAIFRKNYKMMQTAREKGESAPENDWDFIERQFGTWYNDGDGATRFRGSYSPYVDVNKQWFDVLSKIHPDGKLQQIPFTTFLDPETGQIKATKDIARVMIEQDIKGVDAAKIETALRATLNPQLSNQLAISGRYRFKDYTPEFMEEDAKKKFAETKERYTGKLEKLEKSLKSRKAGSPEYQETLDNIKEYKKYLGEGGKKGLLQTQFEDEIETIQTNPEAARAKLYTDQAIRQFANGFDWEETSFKLVDSPIEKVLQADREFAQKIKEFEWKKIQDNISNLREDKKLKIEEAKVRGIGSGFIVEGGAGLEDLPSNLSAMRDEMNSTAMAAQQQEAELIKGLGLKDRNELAKAIQDYYYGGPNGAGDKTKIPVNFRNKVDSYVKNLADAESISKTFNEQKALAEEEAVKKLGFRPSDEDFSNRGNFVVDIPGEGRYTFSPKEVYDYLRKEESGFTGSNQIRAAIDLNKLTEREKKLYQGIRRRYGNTNASVNPQTDAYLNGFRDVLDKRKTFDNTSDATLYQKLLPFANTWTPKMELINTATPESRKTLVGITNGLLQAMSEDEGSRVYGATKKTLETDWLASPEKVNNLNWFHAVQGKQDYLIIKNGDDVARIPMSSTEASQLPSTIRVSGPALRAQSRQTANNGTTSTDGTPQGAIYQPTDFKNVTRGLRVYGNLHQDAENPAINFIEVLIPSTYGYESVMFDVPIGANEADKYVKTVSTQELLIKAYAEALNNDNYKAAIAIAELQKKLKLIK